MVYTATIFGNPITKKNSMRMVNVRGRVIPLPSKAYTDYEVKARVCLTPTPTINKPVNIKVLYFMETRRKCDLTNLLEATDDILVKYKIIEDDNYTIVVGHDGSRVFYDKENPRAEIYIEEI